MTTGAISAVPAKRPPERMAMHQRPAPWFGLFVSRTFFIEDWSMLDFAMLAIAVGLFALTIGYAYACERL
jgi:hypothetical protein